jgi:hypothetical protein
MHIYLHIYISVHISDIDFHVSGPLEDIEWTSNFSENGNDHNSNFYAVKLILNDIGTYVYIYICIYITCS